MDRETRALAEKHFRGLGARLPDGVCGPPGRVDFIEKPDAFSYADFFKGYLLPNVPCVFSSAFTEGWGSRKHWVTPDGKPDLDYLLRKYGDMVVPVANCGVQEYNANPKKHMPLREYISYWKEYIQGNYSSPKGCLYLKDWHLCRDTSVEDVYSLPVYFSSDWLNEYWDAINVDDYRFIYMGPTGTWSPFHADIFRSFSWSVNICGRKKWLLFPPGQEEALRDCHGSLPYDVTSPTLLDVRLHPACARCSPPLEVTQEAGEMLFVPSGWHHQVHNLVIMKSCTGINYEEFYHFLKVIAERRILTLAKEMGAGTVGSVGDSRLGTQQAAFDVSRITEVLASLVANPDFQKVDTSTFSLQPEELLQQLEEVVTATAAL
ncbi:2-oxoglutarate and iron-dependent oxygenase JMJD4 isoform X2 [Elephas maximus indicus]|uniref:2-oxoglutarate and iron-dependent oxygenase JMJD4 isoform X2 n=1 Tax=Elephas maximus indicus TaxID=99487 RepID=UPI002116C802|nr:2-oxoglutarate and iron-dependent oxygenase JMJD4 isoform X2 [Elephas maximus indicus]